MSHSLGFHSADDVTIDCWWRHNNQTISNSLDIDFIHGDIHGRSCKKWWLHIVTSDQTHIDFLKNIHKCTKKCSGKEIKWQCQFHILFRQHACRRNWSRNEIGAHDKHASVFMDYIWLEIKQTQAQFALADTYQTLRFWVPIYVDKIKPYTEYCVQDFTSTELYMHGSGQCFVIKYENGRCMLTLTLRNLIGIVNGSKLKPHPECIVFYTSGNCVIIIEAFLYSQFSSNYLIDK